MRTFGTIIFLLLTTIGLIVGAGYLYILISELLSVSHWIASPIIIVVSIVAFLVSFRLILGWGFKWGYDGGPKKWALALVYIIRYRI